MSDALRTDQHAGPDHMPDTERGTGWRSVSRRSFLKGVGVGAIVVGFAGIRRVSVLGQSASADPLAPEGLADFTETWAEPRVWTPKGTEQLTHHVVQDLNGFRFSYDGASPGPTIRMRGDQTFYLRVENFLTEDVGKSPVGPTPDAFAGYPGPEGAMLKTIDGDDRYGPGLNHIPSELQPDWALGEHLNGIHSAHVTNMHTHGLHVAPGQNENGTFSDDIFLRIVPEEDAVKIAASPALYAAYQENRDEIISSAADFEFRLGNVMEGLIGPDGGTIRDLPHPPGTHWYHPHSHGATQNQVASGMAGFLIVTGDVDDLLNERIAGDVNAPWDQKTGDWDYRERSMFLQRVFIAPTANIGGPSAGPDPDALKKSNAPVAIVNGTVEPGSLHMRPGALERWRVLNGSVDGGGFMRLAVLVGEFHVDADGKFQMADYNSGSRILNDVKVADFAPLSVTVAGTDEPVEKAHLRQLAWDGITLMTKDSSGSWSYRVKDLATVNGGQEPQLTSQADCYKSGNLALCYNRPNELYMADANRADILFQAPPLDGVDEMVYTVVSLPTQLHGAPGGQAKVIAHVVVSGDAVPGGEIAFDDLLAGLEVNPYELPVRDDELSITTPAERAARDIGEGTFYRTRVVRYSGWGGAGTPLTEVNPEYVAQNPELEKLSYYSAPPTESTEYTLPVKVGDALETAAVTNMRRYPEGDLPTLLLPTLTRTMSIDGEKFFPTGEMTPRMLLNTAEEWAVYNQSLDTYSPKAPDSSWTDEQQLEYVRNHDELLYYQFDYVDEAPEGAPTSPQPYFGGFRRAYPMTRAQVANVNAKRAAAGGDPWAVKGQLARYGKGVDHPFHIHQNPFWLTRIDVQDEDGNLVNILPEPRWADVAFVPRNAGRIVFRSRFVDFEGEYVNHCHILLHEDNGMMQRVSVLGNPAETNYEPREAVVSVDAAESDVNELYGKPTPSDSWAQSLQFVDQNNTGQIYPGEGFAVEVPAPLTE